MFDRKPASCVHGRPARFVLDLLLRSPAGTTAAFCAVLMLAAAGCEDTGSGPIDPSGQPPFVSAARVKPDTVDLRKIVPSGDQYLVTITVRADIPPSSDALAPSEVLALLFPPEAGFPTLQIPLYDDGSTPDSAAGDGTYAGTLAFEIPATQAGLYRVRVIAQTSTGLQSIARDRIIPITRNNAPPELSDLTAPDTVNAPTTDRILIAMSVRADDPDGREDVQEVYFKSLDSSDPSRKFFLYDDGNVAASGDRTAGDGIYSIIVELPPGTPARTFRFAFQAEDTFRDTSSTLLHYLTVR